MKAIAPGLNLLQPKGAAAVNKSVSKSTFKISRTVLQLPHYT